MAPVPDPKNGDEGRSPTSEVQYAAGPEVIQVDSQSDSDSGEEDNGGYLPLAQGPDDVDSDDSDDGEEFGQFNSAAEKGKSSSDVPSMPEDQVNTIRAVMANITLPVIPAWARAVPEEKWMSDLILNLKQRNDGDSSTDSTTRSTKQVSRDRSEQDAQQSPSISSITLISDDNKLTVAGANRAENMTESQTCDSGKFDVNFEAHFPS